VSETKKLIQMLVKRRSVEGIESRNKEYTNQVHWVEMHWYDPKAIPLLGPNPFWQITHTIPSEINRAGLGYNVLDGFP
jgi:hypothetical protein